MTAARCWMSFAQGVLTLTGELTQTAAHAFEAECNQLPSLPERFVVDLSGFEIADGVAAVAAVNVMRRLARGRHLVLREAPQLLAHNLYRVAALEDGHITLQSPRDEEPYG